jgi:hypothetical protein
MNQISISTALPILTSSHPDIDHQTYTNLVLILPFLRSFQSKLSLRNALAASESFFF